MKINNKGYASTIIMFSILTLFLVSMLMLVKTMNNSSTLNKKITEKVVDNIDYDSSGSVQDRLSILENQLKNMENSMLDKIYPVGSVYISTTYSTIEEVTNAIGGEWEKYAQGRTIIGDGTVTDSSGNTKIYNAKDGNSIEGGQLSTTLSSSNIPSLSVTGTTNSTGNGYSIGYGTSNRTTSSNGNHTHNMIPYCVNCGGGAFISKSSVMAWYYYDYSSTRNYGMNWLAGNTLNLNVNYNSGITSSSGSHSHTVSDYYANKISGVEAHTHAFTGNYTNKNVESISNESPYVTVYMYKRVK